MTSGGAGGEGQGFGSVSAALIRSVEAPIVLCGPAMSLPGGRDLPVELRNIAIAIDATADGEPAIAHTVRFARLLGARLTLITVVPTGAGPETAAWLDALADRLDEPDLHVSRRVVLSRDTAGSLIRAALEEDADALAIGRDFLDRDPAAAAIVVAAKQPLLI
jgi:nucleotide-binding universal stress UspA family protein